MRIKSKRVIMIRSWNGHTPLIHPDAFISEFAYVVGNVEIVVNALHFFLRPRYF